MDCLKWGWYGWNLNNRITFCVELKDKQTTQIEIDPSQFVILNDTLKDLKGGNEVENARAIVNILNGEKNPFRDIVVMNSMCTLKATNICRDFKEAKEMVIHSIDSKNALNKLKQLREITTI